MADKGVGGDQEEEEGIITDRAHFRSTQQSESRLREMSREVHTSSDDPNSVATSKNDLLIKDMKQSDENNEGKSRVSSRNK